RLAHSRVSHGQTTSRRKAIVALSAHSAQWCGKNHTELPGLAFYASASLSTLSGYSFRAPGPRTFGDKSNQKTHRHQSPKQNELGPSRAVEVEQVRDMERVVIELFWIVWRRMVVVMSLLFG